jgi:hypothetical protein
MPVERWRKLNGVICYRWCALHFNSSMVAQIECITDPENRTEAA